MSDWTEADIPDLSGRTMVVTGANSGLGLRSATVLAEHGARVVLACRSAERGETTLGSITGTGGKADLVLLDLADLASVRTAATRIRELTGDRVDVLMNNAGVMATPRMSTKDGFELQFGANHLGHAALTWLLMPALRATPASRVVTMSSLVGEDRKAEPRRPELTSTDVHAGGRVRAGETGQRGVRQGTGPPTAGGWRGRAQHRSAPRLHHHAADREHGRAPAAASAGAIASGFGAIGNAVLGQDVRIGALPQLFAATPSRPRAGSTTAPAASRSCTAPPRRCPTGGLRLWCAERPE